MALPRGIIAAASWILLAPLAWTQASTPYQLEPDAGYMLGCFDPCTCPLTHAQHLGGSLMLTFVGSTPDWFDHYAVKRVDWTLIYAGQTIHVTGDGRYDIGGNPALKHRLRLNLSFDGGPAKAFDSGLIVGGSTFPQLEIVVSMHGMTCFDEVLDVRAAPLNLGSAYCANNPNSTGKPATLYATGSAAVANNEFTLVAVNGPPSNVGIFFFGQGQQQSPFGEGLLCVSSSILRIVPGTQIDASGTAWQPLDFTQPPAAGVILPGSNWNFQFWYRDPLGGPAGFNLSQALAVAFL
jgi:hypothetical protein